MLRRRRRPAPRRQGVGTEERRVWRRAWLTKPGDWQKAPYVDRDDARILAENIIYCRFCQGAVVQSQPMNPSPPARPPQGRASVRNLPVSLFGSVMGLCGLALAWRLAHSSL